MNVHIAPVELSTSIACHSYKMDGSVPWTYSFDRTVARAVLSLCDLSREHRMNFDASIRKCTGHWIVTSLLLPSKWHLIVTHLQLGCLDSA
jgi:hypothetical protein